MLFGWASPFRMSTPWFALKYEVEKATTFARWAVIVTSSSAKSYFFGAGEKSPLNGARRYCTLVMCNCFAIAWERAYSNPDGFLIVVPVARPFQKPGAGTSNPTISLPDFSVGTARDWRPAAVVAARAAIPAATRNRFTFPSLGLLPGQSRMYRARALRGTEQRSRQARRAAGALPELGACVRGDVNASRLQASAGLRVAFGDERDARREREHVRSHRVELLVRHIDRLDAVLGEELHEAHRRESRVHDREVLVEHAQHRHQMEDRAGAVVVRQVDGDHLDGRQDGGDCRAPRAV